MRVPQFDFCDLPSKMTSRTSGDPSIYLTGDTDVAQILLHPMQEVFLKLVVHDVVDDTIRTFTPGIDLKLLNYFSAMISG